MFLQMHVSWTWSHSLELPGMFGSFSEIVVRLIGDQRLDFKNNKTLYEHFRRWVIKAYCEINLIYRMSIPIRELVNLWSSLPCNDYFTNLGKIKQVVCEWAEFSYRAMFTCSYICRADFENYNNNCWPFFDVQRFERTVQIK